MGKRSLLILKPERKVLCHCELDRPGGRAKQSQRMISRLLRRFTPRNDNLLLTFSLILTLLVCSTLGVSQASCQTEYHGADSVFEKEGIVILWAILKGQDEANSWVHIRIINSGGNPFQFYSVEAVDPFSKEKDWVVKGKKLEKDNIVKSVRTSFRDKTSRKILFYQDMEAVGKETPAMTVFYLGVPDTSPEVLSEKEMDNYFEKALERVKK
jgi:hypothetical protein